MGELLDSRARTRSVVRAQAENSPRGEGSGVAEKDRIDADSRSRSAPVQDQLD